MMTNAQVKSVFNNMVVDEVVDFGECVQIAVLSKWETYKSYKARVRQACLDKWETRKALGQFAERTK